jgi:hypothetical protein
MRFVTTGEAAYVLCVSRQTVYNMIETGKIPIVEIPAAPIVLVNLEKLLRDSGIDPKPYMEELDARRGDPEHLKEAIKKKMKKGDKLPIEVERDMYSSKKKRTR